MKVVVIGGTGLIGSRVVRNLAAHGHDATPASPDTGVNTITREGLAEALDGAAVVVDVSNAPAWDDAAVLQFFETSTRNILNAEATAGVKHHVALSIVGTERPTFQESGYVRAKVAQEELIQTASIPFSIVHATQFFEFGTRIAAETSDENAVRVPDALIQPMATDDVATAVCDVAIGPPVNGTIEIGGPEPMSFEDFVRRALRAAGDQRTVEADSEVRYFGAHLSEGTLLPGQGAKLAPTTFDEWLSRHAAAG